MHCIAHEQLVMLSSGLSFRADTKTKFAQHGDVGTQVLKEIPGYEPPAYKAGGTAEVTWQVRNNHGGGCK